MNIDNHVAERVFGDTTYKLIKLPPRIGGRVAANVGKLLAAAIGDDQQQMRSLIEKGMEFIKNKDSIEAVAKDGAAESDMLSMLLNDGPQLLTALTGGLARLDVDEVYDIAYNCIKHGAYAGSVRLNDDAAIDKHFADVPEQLLPVMVWALQVNCKGFFAKSAPA